MDILPKVFLHQHHQHSIFSISFYNLNKSYTRTPTIYTLQPNICTMISPLTLIVVLATTLTIASPLPEPKNNAWSTKPITVDGDKWANFYCFGIVPEQDLASNATNLSQKGSQTRPCFLRNPWRILSTILRSWQTSTRPSNVSHKKILFLSASPKQVTNPFKAMNKQGEEFPCHFDFTGKGTKILEDLSDVCKQGQADTAYLQHPLGFKNGSLTSSESVLALAYGKWPNFTKFQYCGVLTTQRPKKTAKTPRGYSLCRAIPDPKASGTSTASKTPTAQKTSMKTPKASKAQKTSMKTPQASKRSIEE